MKKLLVFVMSLKFLMVKEIFEYVIPIFQKNRSKIFKL